MVFKGRCHFENEYLRIIDIRIETFTFEQIATLSFSEVIGKENGEIARLICLILLVIIILN